MIPQVNSDWSATYTPEEFEKEFQQKFCGPGWYLTDLDSLLVIGNPPEDRPIEKCWNALPHWPKDTTWHVYVYNCTIELTIFGRVSGPTRNDIRGEPISIDVDRLKYRKTKERYVTKLKGPYDPETILMVRPDLTIVDGMQRLLLAKDEGVRSVKCQVYHE